MPRSKTETRQRKHLGRYVTRVMGAKDLSPRDVAVNSGNRITPGYVVGLMKGTSANPSVDKLKALAAGLGVDLYELFDVACGLTAQHARSNRGTERLRTLELIEMMKRLAVNPLLLEMVETGSKLPQEHLEVMLRAMERLANARWEAPLRAKRRRP